MKEKVSGQIRIGAIISYGTVIINLILTLAYTPWMIHTLGREHYGLYALAASIIGLTTFDFGLSAATARYLAKYRAERKPELGNEFLGIVFKIYGILDMILAIIFIAIYSFLDLIYKGLNQEELNVLRTIFLILAVYNLIAFYALPINGILQSYEKFIAITLCDLGQRLLTTVLVIICLLNGRGVEAVVMSNAAAGLIIIILKFCIVKSKVPLVPRFQKFGIDKFGEIISFSVWSMLGNLAVSLPYNLAPSVLAITLNSTSVALFSPVSVFGAYFNTIARAINGMFLATISRYVAENKNDKILSLMIKIGRYQTFILGLVYVGFVCVGDIFILLWLGKEFHASYYCGIFYLFPLVLRYSQQIGNTAIIARNYVKEQGIISVVICVAGSVFMFVMSKMFGLIGGCMALSLMDITYVLGMDYIYCKKMDIHIFEFYRQCYGTMILPAVVVIFIGRFLLNYIGDISIVWFVVKGLFVIILYFLLMWMLGLKIAEKEFIIKLIRKVLQWEKIQK